jgi:hypothetical protein
MLHRAGFTRQLTRKNGHGQKAGGGRSQRERQIYDLPLLRRAGKMRRSEQHVLAKLPREQSAPVLLRAVEREARRYHRRHHDEVDDEQPAGEC